MLFNQTSIIQPTQDRESAYRALEAAYAEAYAKADAADGTNRSLVYRYIATSSSVVSSEIRATFQNPQLAGEAERFANAAESKDPVKKGIAVYQFLKPLIPGSLIIGIALGAVSFAINLVAGASEAGEHTGAALGGIVLTGGAGYFLVRFIAMAAQNAAKAGEAMLEAVAEAFRSNAKAKAIVAAIGGSEARLLGPGPALRRAQRDHLLVDLTGPAAGVALTLFFAVPLVGLAVYLAGVLRTAPV
jgi:hypothetical protein